MVSSFNPVVWVDFCTVMLGQIKYCCVYYAADCMCLCEAKHNQNANHIFEFLVHLPGAFKAYCIPLGGQMKRKSRLNFALNCPRSPY